MVNRRGFFSQKFSAQITVQTVAADNLGFRKRNDDGRTGKPRPSDHTPFFPIFRGFLFPESLKVLFLTNRHFAAGLASFDVNPRIAALNDEKIQRFGGLAINANFSFHQF